MFLLTLELLESCDCFYNYFCCCFFRFCFSSLNQWCLKPLEFARIVSLYFHCYCSTLFSFPSSWILLLICFCFCHCCHFFHCFFISFFQSSSILRLNQELMSSRASLRTAGNSRKSWEENDKWDHKSTIQSPFYSYIMMRKSELTWGFVCLIFVFLNCSSFGRDLVRGSRVELDGLVFRRAVPAHQNMIMMIMIMT